MAICALSLMLLSKTFITGSGRWQIWEEEGGSAPHCLSLCFLVEILGRLGTGHGKKQG